MPKVIVTLDGKVVANHEIRKSRTTIGRRPGHDLVLDSPGVSGDHAALNLTGDKLVLEDLGSTNGTLVNGAHIKSRPMGDGDVATVGAFLLKVVADPKAMAYEATMMVTKSPVSQQAVLELLDGAPGREMALTKVVTTLGRAGVCVVAVIRRGAEHAVKFTDGTEPALLNGAPLGPDPAPLKSGDVLTLAGSRLRFLLRDAAG